MAQEAVDVEKLERELKKAFALEPGISDLDRMISTLVAKVKMLEGLRASANALASRDGESEALYLLRICRLREAIEDVSRAARGLVWWDKEGGGDLEQLDMYALGTRIANSDDLDATDPDSRREVQRLLRHASTVLSIIADASNWKGPRRPRGRPRDEQRVIFSGYVLSTMRKLGVRQRSERPILRLLLPALGLKVPSGSGMDELIRRARSRLKVKTPK